VIRERAGHAFDPAIATLLVDEAAEILALEASASAWEETLLREPRPHLTLEGAATERALAAMGDFTDLSSPYLVGHSAGVAELAGAAAACGRLPPAEVVVARRARLVHDLGRVAVPVRIWQKPGPLTADEWERVRLHPYFTERVLTHSSFLSELAPVASSHHERLDGSGYHRGLSAAMLTQPARLLAAADAYHAMTEARPHRTPLSPALAAETCGPPPGRLGRSLVSKRCQLTPVCAWPRVGERRQLLIAGSNRQHVVRLLALNEPATTRLEAEKPHV
jgi:HD-GYP domain-containing protein (c-di-GMP phosphodiesterase class II)